MVLKLVSCNGREFSPDDWKYIDQLRATYKHNRKIETDFHFLLINEMLSPVHASVSGFAERKLGSMVVTQLFLPDPDPSVEDLDRIRTARDGRDNFIC